MGQHCVGQPVLGVKCGIGYLEATQCKKIKGRVRSSEREGDVLDAVATVGSVLSMPHLSWLPGSKCHTSLGYLALLKVESAPHPGDQGSLLSALMQ